MAQSISTTTVAESQPRSHETSDGVLAKRVSVNIDHVSLEVAIRTVALKAKIQILYQLESLEGFTQPVSVHVTDVPVGTVLTQVLNGTGLRVVPDGSASVLITSGDERAAQERGGVAGVVVNAATKQPVRGATVTLDDSARAVRTDDGGHYHFGSVSAGVHRLTVRYVGFARQSRSVTVDEGKTATVNIGLDASVNTLDQVVVTATGEQRVRELGHVVARINVDSLVKTAPITDLSDLLQSRVPGLQVVPGSGGYAGETVALQLRGASSMALNSAPIVIVDGVRYQSDNSIDNGANHQDLRGGNTQQRSPLNDLNPNDIATIEVVKGPSASTLYGPDAANGVIVVTTKRGKIGTPQFRWYARPVTSSVPEPGYSQTSYKIWSHSPTTGAPILAPCTLALQYVDHYCVLDSITLQKSVIQVDSLSPIAKNRPTWQYGASLSGGSQASRYFLSGNYSNQVGSLQVPPALQRLIAKTQGPGVLSKNAPNSLATLGMQVSLSSEISSWFSMDGTANIAHVNNNRSAQPTIFSRSVGFGAQRLSDSASLASFIATNGYTMVTALASNTEEANRIVGSFSPTLRPASWLSVNAQVGTDLNFVKDYSVLAGGMTQYNRYGYVRDDRRATTGRNGSLMVNTTFHPSRFSFRTSTGVQYVYHHLDGTDADASGLPTGSTNAYLAQYQRINPVWDETVQLGMFGEEVVGLNDRLFLTGSLRYDGSTTFGDTYDPTPFPKLGVSWIASEEPWLPHVPGVNELRFRYSYGSASRHPTTTMRVGGINASMAPINNTQETEFFTQNFASPTIHPERSSEHEWGADATILNGATLQLTWWNRNVIDELTQLQGQRIGISYYWLNGATVAKHGFEASMTLPLFTSPQVQAEMQLNYATNTSKVVSMPTGPLAVGAMVGYPVDPVFGQRILGYADTAGGRPDSIITRDEVQLGPYVYMGVTTPPRTFSVSPQLLLFHGIVRIASLVDRASGFVTTDNTGYQCQSNATCLAPFLRSTPLAVQALYASGSRDAFNVLTSSTRWREFSITASVPTVIMKHLNVFNFQLLSSASVSLQGRNLAQWSNYKGTDPESRLDRDPSVSTESDGIPQARSWSLRFDFNP